MLAAALDQMWAYRGPSLNQWDMLFGEMIEKQRQALMAHMKRLDDEKAIALQRRVEDLEEELRRATQVNEALTFKMSGLETMLAKTKHLMRVSLTDSLDELDDDDGEEATSKRAIIEGFRKIFASETSQNRRELLHALLGRVQSKDDVTSMLKDVLLHVETDQTFQLVEGQLRYLATDDKLEVAKTLIGLMTDHQSDQLLDYFPNRFGGKTAHKFAEFFSRMKYETRSELLLAILGNLKSDDQQILLEHRAKNSRSDGVQTEPFHPLEGCHNFPQHSLDDELRRILNFIPIEQPRIIARMLEMMNVSNRLNMVKCLCDRDVFTQAEVDVLNDCYNAKAISFDKSPQLDWITSNSAGAFRLFRKPKSNTDEKPSIFTFDATMRSLADIWTKKMMDDADNDKRGKARTSFAKFLKEYFLSQFGFKHTANKGFADIFASSNHYAHSAPPGTSSDRAKVFLAMLGMNGVIPSAKASSLLVSNRSFKQSISRKRMNLSKVGSIQKRLGTVGRSSLLVDAEANSGSFGSAAKNQVEQWSDTKIDFFMWFLYAITMNDGGSKISKQASSWESLKEALSSPKMLVQQSTVRHFLNVGCSSDLTRDRILEKLKEVPSEGEVLKGSKSDSACWRVDDILMIVMDAWDEAISTQIAQMKRSITLDFAKFDLNGDGMLSYSEFGDMLRNICPDRADEMLLDIYDEALQASSTNEVAKYISPEAWAHVILKHRLVNQLGNSFIDPLNMNSEPQAEKRDRSSPKRRMTKVAVKAPAVVPKKTKPVKTEKSEHINNLITTAVSSNFLFRQLPPPVLQRIIGYMQMFEFSEGQVVMHEGDMGDYFYVQESGVFDVFITIKDSDGPTKVRSYTVSEGSNPCFGELALMYAKPRAATVVCVESGVLWGLDRVAFTHVQTHVQERDLTRTLSQVETLKLLPFASLQLLREKMVDRHFKQGEEIITADTQVQHFYILQSGSVVCSDPRQQEDPVTLEEGAWFAEKALLPSYTSPTTVTAHSDVSCMVLARADVDIAIGPLEGVLEELTKTMEAEKDRYKSLVESEGLQNCSLGSFTFGGVARVSSGYAMLLAKHKDSNQAYTLRAHSKKSFTTESANSLLAEEAMLQRLGAQGPHSTTLALMVSSFPTESLCCLVYKRSLVTTLEQCSQLRSPENELLRQWCAMCVVEALSMLHSSSLILRNLSPSELMIDDKGYVVVCNFANCKLLEKGNRTYSLCGIPEFLSPEHINRIQGYGMASDWWALGVLLFSLRCGSMPFGSGNELAIFRKVADHQPGQLEFAAGDNVNRDFIDFTNSLCHPEESRRLGTRGAHEVRSHKWFQGTFDFDALRSGTAASPFLEQCTKQLGELSSADPKASARLLAELGEFGDTPPDQSFVSVFGTLHPKSGKGFCG